MDKNNDKNDDKNDNHNIVKKKKISKKRCYVCNKKLSLVPYSCKCNSEILFCPQHRYPEAHNCQYNWKEETMKKLIKENPKIEHSKVDKID